MNWIVLEVFFEGSENATKNLHGMDFGQIQLQTSLNQEKWKKTGFVHNSIKRTHD